MDRRYTTTDMEALAEALSRFFKTTHFTLTPIEGGASSRIYFRIDFREESYFPGDAVMLMVVPPPDMRLLTDYMHIDYYLRRMQVPTPRLYELDQSTGWIFLKFESAPTLENYLLQHPLRTEDALVALSGFLRSLQQKCRREDHCPAFQRRFDYDHYQFEFSFHVQEQLLGFYDQTPYDSALLLDFAKEISTVLDITHPVFVHRDFQSSNIFIHPRADGKFDFSVIDFQDARYGTPVYDLVSFLWDSYLAVPEDLQARLVEEFYRHLEPDLGIGWDRAHYQRIVDYSIIQRKLRDAGIFADNYRRSKNQRYLAHLDSALRMALVPMAKYPAFREMRQLLERLV